MIWTTQPRSEGAGGLSYFCVGQGPALVLIHGVGLRAEAWGAVLPCLSAHYRVFAVDMPGHGGSALEGVQSLDDYVDRVQCFVETLEAPAHVAGHSMGAIIAMKLAARMGADLAGMAAFNAIYRRSAEARAAVLARAAAISAKEAADNAPTLARWFGPNPTGEMRAAAEACDGWLNSVDRTGYARAYTAFAQQDGPSEDELAAITCPALFMTGAGDLNSTPEMSQAMAAQAPKGRAKSITDAAHMMPMTHGAAVAAALMDAFQPRRAMQ